MGTNYYLVKKAATTQPPIHIGKSSHGWLFSFQTTRYQDCQYYDPKIEWNTWDQVKSCLYDLTEEKQTHVILDEYDEAHSYEEFVEMVEAKQADEFCQGTHNFSYSRNVNGYRFCDDEFS